MFGFRPGRNRKHPGDQPPKWAPIGRAGRFVLVGTVIVGIIIALVITTTRTAGAADDTDWAATVMGPSSPPGSSQRVEVREAGYAVSFPEGWVVEVVGEGFDRDLLVFAQPERFGPEVELRQLLVAFRPEWRGRYEYPDCILVRYAPIDLTADEFLTEAFGQSEDLAVESLREGLSRVFMNQWGMGRVLTDQPEHVYVGHYTIGGDSAVALLWCVGVASDGGDWLSIAESFEFLPAASLSVVSGLPASALGPDDEQPGSPSTRSDASPLLDALAFKPIWIDYFEFTDWTALKTLHGGAHITSASPLEERHRLVLDMVNSEARASDFGLERLATWPELWGWDNTDLVWEATLWTPGADSSGKVLRFRDDWDPEPFIARLDALGYSRHGTPYGVLFSDPPDFTAGPDTEAILDADERLLTAAPHTVAVSQDGRTVVVWEGGGAVELLKIAARADPGEVAASQFGRAASALGQPVTATIVDRGRACEWAGLVDVDYSEDMDTLARSVGPLHRYQALAMGYERAGPGEPAMGRYAFAYKRAKQATADLPGRRTLADEGYSSRHGQRYRDAAFTLVDASADDRMLVLDVVPLYDYPQVFHDLLVGRSLSFAACGS